MPAEAKTEPEDLETGFFCYRLKPHFLFNALALVSALAGQDSAKSKELLLDLSDLLRAGIGCGESDLHSLEDELALARCYASINAARFTNRLQVIFQTSDGIAAQVPVFSLVSVLEVAIPEVLKAGGSVSILVAAAVKDTWVSLSVRFSCLVPCCVSVRTSGELAFTDAQLVRLFGSGLKQAAPGAQECAIAFDVPCSVQDLREGQ